MHSLCIPNQYIAIKQNFQGIFVCLDKPFTQVRDKNIFMNFVHDIDKQMLIKITLNSMAVPIRFEGIITTVTFRRIYSN